ncbi:MAG: hypothetical protein JSS79_20475 [Bacteroidetes bacterium]|nr:hypothetical protein [Bacteroidota bacterium]
MEKMDTLERELREAFESGFSNATASLAKLTGNKIYFNNFHYGTCPLASGYLTNENYQHSKEPSILLTTELFGDWSGKSYLFLSERELDLLTQRIPESRNQSVSLKEEFVKEVDNIISAAVITKLSNELGVKMYGDVPNLIGRTSCNTEDIIADDFCEATDLVYINSIYFSFSDHPSITPLFVWVLDCSTMKRIKKQA